MTDPCVNNCSFITVTSLRLSCISSNDLLVEPKQMQWLFKIYKKGPFSLFIMIATNLLHFRTKLASINCRVGRLGMSSWRAKNLKSTYLYLSDEKHSHRLMSSYVIANPWRSQFQEGEYRKPILQKKKSQATGQINFS